MSRIIHRSAGKYPLNQKRRRGGTLSEGGRREEVIHLDAVDAASAMSTKQETKFYPYPEWRERMLQKCVASGRHGFLTSPAWGAKLNPNTGLYELPRKLQKSQQDGEAEGEGEGEREGKGKETLDEEESEPESLMSDAEWEGWRKELELEGPTRPNSPGLKIAQDGSPWTSESTQQSYGTQLDGPLRTRVRKNTLISGRDKVLEGIVKRTTEHSVHPYSIYQAQASRASTLSSLSASASVVLDTVASSSIGLGLSARHASSPSISAVISPRQSLSAPNRARSATVSTPSAAFNPPSHNNHDPNHDLAIPLPSLPDAPENGRLPGLGGGLSSASRSHNTVTTISALRSTGNEPAPKKGRSNKGKRRERTEDHSGGEEGSVESTALAVEHPNDTWTRSHDEGLNWLRHMPSSSLRRSSSKHSLLKNFGLRDR